FVGLFALRAGITTVVQAAIVGSNLGNGLLVLGLAFLAGGLRHGTQHFGSETPRLIAVLTALAVAALALPTLVETPPHPGRRPRRGKRRGHSARAGQQARLCAERDSEQLAASGVGAGAGPRAAQLRGGQRASNAGAAAAPGRGARPDGGPQHAHRLRRRVDLA